MATALYRRYRPETFADVIGQDHVTVPLMRALRNNRVGHAYLFSGPRGCGKTTSARILARCLNCAEGPTDTPCGHCDSCRELANDGPGSIDVVEIDAASHGGVDDARELRERATFAPARDRYKVFIIDEAHMVTSAGFNALLKLVEEPPEHVKFIFATTEPDKVIGTIRSRTFHYPFRLIPPQIMTPYLEKLCAAEDVQVGKGVLPLVVRAGGGSARDTISVLDQLMAGAGDDGIDYPSASSLLGFTDAALLDAVIDAFAARDAATVFEAVDRVVGSGQEPRRFVEDLLERLRDLIVIAAVPDHASDFLPEAPADQLERMQQQAGVMGGAELSREADVVNEALSTMTGATSPRIHLELLCARILVGGSAGQRSVGQSGAGQAGAVRGGAGQSGGRPAGGSAGGPGGQYAGAAGGRGTGGHGAASEGNEGGDRAGAGASPSGPPVSAPVADAREQARQMARQKAQAARAAREGQPASGGQPEPAGHEGDRPVQPTPQPEPEPAAAPEPDLVTEPSGAAGEAGMDVGAVRDAWPQILEALSHVRRPSWALVAQNATVNAFDGTTLSLGFPTPGLLRAFERGTAAANVAEAVDRTLGLSVQVVGVTGDGPGPSAGQPGGGQPGGGHPSGAQSGGRPSGGGQSGGRSAGGQSGGQPGNGRSGGTAPDPAAPRNTAPDMQDPAQRTPPQGGPAQRAESAPTAPEDDWGPVARIPGSPGFEAPAPETAEPGAPGPVTADPETAEPETPEADAPESDAAAPAPAADDGPPATPSSPATPVSPGTPNPPAVAPSPAPIRTPSPAPSPTPDPARAQLPAAQPGPQDDPTTTHGAASVRAALRRHREGLAAGGRNGGPGRPGQQGVAVGARHDRLSPPPEPPLDDEPPFDPYDPYQGASPDDADLDNRAGREIVEKILGGSVVEVREGGGR